MSQEEYAAVQSQILTLAALLNRLPLAEVVEAIAHADALGPIVDPTAYKNAGSNLDFMRNASLALYEAQSEIRAAYARHPEIAQVGGMDLVMAAAGNGARL